MAAASFCSDVPAEPDGPRPAPLSTYRVQLHPGFGFDDVVSVVGYLADLGVSHLYSSPCLQAAPGSTHGYDVVDHGRINVELGGDEGHRRLCDALVAAGLGQILDIVPNHMAIGGRENAWWWDVLENGPASLYASYFDVDWDPPEAKLRHKVLLAILGDHYGRVLEAGELRLARERGSFVVRYHDHVAPLAPPTMDGVLAAAAQRCASDELESLATALGRLPHSTLTDGENVRERHRDKEVLADRLAALCGGDAAVAAAVDALVEETNADPDRLDAVLERQNYRLAYWRTAGQELDYRRFFDITSLIGLRVEDPLVFEDTHRLVLDMVADGRVDGLRIDHPDGLRDPEGYLVRLAEATGGAWVVVEKILEPGEELPGAWPVAGTTGYEALNRIGGLFVDPAGHGPMMDLHLEMTGQEGDWAAVVGEKKHQVLRQVLAADLNGLTAAFVRVCERHRRFRDYTRHELHEVLREVAAAFGVYRSYVRVGAGGRQSRSSKGGSVSDADVAHVEAAVAAAAARRPDLDRDLWGFLADLLLLRSPGVAEGPEAELVARFQQLTGPVMAKGVEDTAFYTYIPLVSLNEVGGDPSHFGVPPDQFHRATLGAQRRHPTAMVTTATHDTKRGEDTRARIALLSEIPDRWREAVCSWRKHNDRHRTGEDRPDGGAEYLLYQTLVGAWPLPVDRVVAYMEKASREAKVHTSWTEPDPDYDGALAAFVGSVLADGWFRAELADFVAPLVDAGRVTSLAQKLVALTVPGVPDVYQGTELWDHSLVDPDNRRPVDYDLRRSLLAELDAGLAPEEILARADEGLPKLAVTAAALRLRRRRPGLFGPDGGYEELALSGPSAGHAVAFCRGGAAVTVVPRLVLGLHRGGGWAGTVVELPPGRWCNVFTGAESGAGPVPVADLLNRFPVALLTSRVHRGRIPAPMHSKPQ
ncbi:MAG: malto-oligosyltrehalose synthase [Acidimicrobiales bacterium]